MVVVVCVVLLYSSAWKVYSLSLPPSHVIQKSDSLLSTFLAVFICAHYLRRLEEKCGPLGLDLQMDTSCIMWVLGIQDP